MGISLNKVFLMGNLTRDPELRYVPSGQAVASFAVAVNRVYTTQTGEKKEEVSYVNVVVWARRAEVCGEYLSKGSPVFIEGRLQSRSWEDQSGNRRSTMEVIANNVQFLRFPPRTGAAKAPAPEEVESIDLGADAQPAERKPSGQDARGDDGFRNEFGQAPAAGGQKNAPGADNEVPF